MPSTTATSVSDATSSAECRSPFGLISLGVAYLAFALSIRFIFGEDNCLLDDENEDNTSAAGCQSEGVNNTILAWASDYFVAAVACLQAFHLNCFKRSTRKSGTLAQVFLAGTFGLMGVLRQLYPNSGQTDNRGQMEHWIVGAITVVFFTFSAAAQATFCLETAAVTPQSKRPCGAILFVRLWLATIILVAILHVVGSTMCVLESELHTIQVEDNYEDNLYWNERHVCLQMVGLSENLIWFPYALLWVPMGLLLRAGALQRPSTVLGLSNVRAARAAVLFHWFLGGSMYLVVVSFASWIRHELVDGNEETFLELWNRVYGTEVFHLGILLSSYCAHNLTWTLTIPSIPSTSARQASRSTTATTGEQAATSKTFLKVIPEEESSDEPTTTAADASKESSRQVRFSEELSTTDVDLEKGGSSSSNASVVEQKQQQTEDPNQESTNTGRPPRRDADDAESTASSILSA